MSDPQYMLAKTAYDWFEKHDLFRREPSDGKESPEMFSVAICDSENDDIKPEIIYYTTSLEDAKEVSRLFQAERDGEKHPELASLKTIVCGNEYYEIDP